MTGTIPSSPGRAATLGAGAAFAVSLAGGVLGGCIERQWNVVVVSWEMAGLMVSVLVTVSGFLVGSAAAMTHRVVPGTLLGAVLVGAVLAGIAMTNGSPRGVVVWTISVAIFAGAASGAVGGFIGRQSRTGSDEADGQASDRAAGK